MNKTKFSGGLVLARVLEALGLGPIGGGNRNKWIKRKANDGGFEYTDAPAIEEQHFPVLFYIALNESTQSNARLVSGTTKAQFVKRSTTKPANVIVDLTVTNTVSRSRRNNHGREADY